MHESFTTSKVIHVECIDLTLPSPGGVESLVLDMISFGNVPQSLVGVSKGGGISTGKRQICHSSNGRSISWLPVATMPKRRLIPDSISLIIGLLLQKKSLDSHHLFVAHRFEVGLALKLMGLRYAQFVHNDSTGLLGSQSESFWRNFPKTFRFVEKTAVKSAQLVVAFNKSEAIRLSLLNRNCHRSQSWFDDSTFTFSPTSTKKLSGCLKILWVGRLESQKNPQLAVDIANYLGNQGVDFELNIVGSGSLQDDLQKKIIELGLVSKVKLVGSKRRLEIAKEMEKSDCLMLTSHSEGSPVVLAEAASSGLASVVSLNGDPDSFIEDGVNGFRVQADTPERFARAILDSVTLNKSEIANSAMPRSRSAALPRIESLLSQVI